MAKRAQEKDAQSTFSFAHIQYLGRNGYRSLPEWALFFLELGKILSTLEIDSHRYTIALALPTRSYATALIGAGIACSRIFLKSDEISDHIETIYSLPEDTSLKYYDNGKVKKALKKDLVEYNGIRLLGIQIEDHTTIYLRPENVNKVEIADVDYNHLPNKQGGYSVALPSKLAYAILQGRSYEFFYRSRIEGFLVGSRNTLKEEASLTLSITQHGEEKYGTGSLTDLFRVKGFVPNNVGHRFLLTSPSSSSNTIIEALQQVPAHCPVIFDGAIGFLKWKEMFADQDWIVILDQTDLHFPNAVSQLNQDYSRRSESGRNIEFPQLPNGIEATFFLRDL